MVESRSVLSSSIDTQGQKNQAGLQRNQSGILQKMAQTGWETEIITWQMVLQKVFLYQGKCLITAEVEILINKQCLLKRSGYSYKTNKKQSFPISFIRECQIEYRWDLIISCFGREKHKHTKNQTF